jgi:hypothetical protein
MRVPKFAMPAALGLFALVTPVLAQDAETNKQSPAPQGTAAPASNDKADQGAARGTTATEEQKNSQSPGKSVETDLSKKAKDDPANPGTSGNREASNPEVPAPNNTTRPE